MRIISIKTIKNFWEDKCYNDSKQPLRAWYYEVKKAVWRSSTEVKQKYENASILGNGRIVFNITENKYRLVVAINYKLKVVFIRFIGTHCECGKIDVRNI